MTHRQYLAWQDWLDSEEDRPTLTDDLVMQLTELLYYSRPPATLEGFDPGSWRMSKKRTSTAKPRPIEMTDEERREYYRTQAKMIIGSLGGKDSVNGAERLK